MYHKNIENGYILSVVSGVSEGNIAQSEYNSLINAIRGRPIAPDGYDYRLREDLSWELYELPPATEDD